MNNIDVITKKLYDKIKKYSCIISFNFYRKNNEYYEIDNFVEIILSEYPYYDEDKVIKLKFKGVESLKLGKIDSLCTPFITIVDVAENGLENIRFKIVEEEEALFSFYCEEFEFIDEYNDIIN